jgi:hypothetical protein
MKNFSPALFKPSSTLLVDDDLFFIENVCDLLPTHTPQNYYPRNPR